MEKISSKIPIVEVIFNVFVTPLLSHILIISLILAAIMASYNRYYVMPVFSGLLIGNIEKEAQRTGKYLASNLLIDDKYKNNRFQYDPTNKLSSPPFDLNNEEFTAGISAKVKEYQYYFQIEKMKVFNQSGKIVFSTDRRDIGGINIKPYFLNTVAKGELFSKIVHKDTKSSEGLIMTRDVVEIYVPLINKSDFQGALEIYYDISERKKALDVLVSRASSIINFIIVVSLLLIAVMLYKASIQIMKRRSADTQLQDAKNLLEIRVSKQTEEIRLTQKVSIEALSIMAEYHDEDTGEHLRRIKSYVEILTLWLMENSIYGKYLSRKPSYVEDLKLACLLHDVGKTAIPVEMLNKPAKLTDEEFDVMKKHTFIAGESLGRANENFRREFNSDSYLALARDISLYHHEKWNGKGYPKGLSGESIPLAARIVAVADVYDALRNKRPYKEAWTHIDAHNEIVKGRSEHFDPIIVDAFISLSDKFFDISKKYNESKGTERTDAA